MKKIYLWYYGVPWIDNLLKIRSSKSWKRKNFLFLEEKEENQLFFLGFNLQEVKHGQTDGQQSEKKNAKLQPIPWSDTYDRLKLKP